MQFSIISLIALAGTTVAAPPVLVPRVDCSSSSCQKLVDEGSCLLDAGENIIKILKCLNDAGGVSNVSCIRCYGPETTSDLCRVV